MQMLCLDDIPEGTIFWFAGDKFMRTDDGAEPLEKYLERF